MTTQTDLKAYAVALAKEKWPVDIETVECEPVEKYAPPAPRGDYFTSNLPYEIAEDEPEIRVEFTFFPEEEATRYDPGHPADVEIDTIVGLSRELTAQEEAAALALQLH